MSGDSGSNNDHYEGFAGSSLVSGQSATAGDIVIISVLFDGSSSVIRVNQNETTGDAGTASLNGITHGATGDGNGQRDVNIGEMLVYPQDKSSKVSDIEQYLIDKWGPVSFA